MSATTTIQVHRPLLPTALAVLEPLARVNAVAFSQDGEIAEISATLRSGREVGQCSTIMFRVVSDQLIVSIEPVTPFIQNKGAA